MTRPLLATCLLAAVKCVGAQTVLLSNGNGQLIDGAATVEVSNGNSNDFVSNNSNWVVV